ESQSDVIAACQPLTRFNRCGYLLHDVLSAEHLDLPRLLVGSEGTLGIFTEATLRTIPLPVSRSIVLLGFDSVDAALRAAGLALPSRPCACELIDRRLLTLAREHGPDVKAYVPAGAEAVLLIEFESDTPAGAREAALASVDRLQRTLGLALHTVTAFAEDEIERLWLLRETILPSLYGLKGGTQPVAFVEDVGVPVEALAVYLHKVQDFLQTQETTASFLIHAGSGQVHTRPFLDLQKPEDQARLWAIAEHI